MRNATFAKQLDVTMQAQANHEFEHSWTLSLSLSLNLVLTNSNRQSLMLLPFLLGMVAACVRPTWKPPVLRSLQHSFWWADEALWIVQNVIGRAKGDISVTVITPRHKTFIMKEDMRTPFGSATTNLQS